MRRWPGLLSCHPICYPAHAFAKRGLQATTMAAIDAAARLDRDWLSRGISDPASLRAHALRYGELKGREITWALPGLKNPSPWSGLGHECWFHSEGKKSALTPTADVMRSKHKRRDGPLGDIGPLIRSPRRRYCWRSFCAGGRLLCLPRVRQNTTQKSAASYVPISLGSIKIR
jgi:hypothetical protein